MNDQSDSQLLRAYAENRSEPAFAELVRRHVDLVHSAALRMVCDSHLAEDVTQGAFMALAKNAGALKECLVLSGWLHRTARNIAAQTVRTDVRRRIREQEAAAMNEVLADSGTGVPPVWSEIAPHLDDALSELSEPDRDALLLRYFERKSAREMAQALGISDEAAQKRVNRAVERMRDFFIKRGVSVGASGLVVAISTNAVQAAPAALALTISTTAAITGTAIASTTITATAIAMTTLQKTIIGATLAAAIGTGIYQTHQSSQLRDRLDTLQQQQAREIQQLQDERDDEAARVAALRDENKYLRNAAANPQRQRAREQASVQTPAPADRPASSPALSAAEPAATDLPKDSWADVGFATPQQALQTRGWAVLNGNRERFKESVFVTDSARKTMEDMLIAMVEQSNDPNKAQFVQQILDDKLGVEEGILMPMMAENQHKGYTGYRILSQQSPSADETIVQLETQMASAPARQETLKLRRFENDWKVVIDDDFVAKNR